MDSIEVLNVSVIEPRFKHSTIFEKFDSKLPGDALIIHNDHDPKPLYYQLMAERGQTFTWEYLENGPDIWRVKIAKREADPGEETIGEMVAKDYRKAQAFKKLGIDFCCGGKKTLSEVSKNKGISMYEINAQLEAVTAMNADQGVLDFDKCELDFLSDYIINTHHHYCRESIPFISAMADKVSRVHGGSHPELITVAELFQRIAQDLNLHMSKEERILFPFIKELVKARETGSEMVRHLVGEIVNPIRVMEMDHEQLGEDLNLIRKLTSDFTLPAGACNSYTILFKKLEEFESDMQTHVHLENYILFPKALHLEKELEKAGVQL